MTSPVGRWRAAYTPGDWLVLSGPTSVVVLEPATEQWSSLVPALWNEVIASASLVDLAAQLARYRIDTMPNFAAFFWTDAGMRSLVRGAVQVLDPDTGSVVADGDGIQTWSEIGLDGLTQVRVRLPAAREYATGPPLSLPLVVGAVRASSLTLDTSTEAHVFSPQEHSAPAEVDGPTGDDADHDTEGEVEGPTTQLMTDPFLESQPAEVDEPEKPPAPDDPDLATSAVAAPGSGRPVWPPPFSFESENMENGDTQLMLPPELDAVTDPEDPGLSEDSGASQDSGPSESSMVLAVICPYGHSSPQDATTCRVCGSPIADRSPRLVARPPLALLRASDGSTVEVDRAVLLGRAPSANLSTALAPRLMTVLSPGHDISRTHVEIAPEDWQIVVTDLRSTNGTVLVRPGSGERQQLPPGEPVSVPLQSLLELGDGVSVLIDFPH